jgi:phosphatidylglycerol:prolipoprotein diacylglycerol transferase
MYPEALRVGSFVVSSFGVMMVVAFLAAYAQLRWGMGKLGIGTSDDAGALVFSGGLFGIVGAKLYFALLYQDWSAFFSRYGLVWYGGFLGGTAAVVWTLSRRRLPAWPMLDVLAPALALGYGLGRIGCFLVGDDYGLPTDRPWGVAFPNGLPPTTAYYLREEFGVELSPEIPDHQVLRVHPTQLYETTVALLLWGGGFWALRRGLLSKPPGRLGLGILLALSLERFWVEFFRAKDDRFLGSLTLAQGIALLVSAVALGLLVHRGQRISRPSGSVS